MDEAVMNCKSKGFTIVEILVVLAIIGVLAAIAIPQYSAQREKSVRAAMVADAKNTATLLEDVYEDCKVYPALVVPAGGSQVVSLSSLGGECAGMPATATVTFLASKGNTITNTAGTAYSIVVSNPGAGPGNSPLTMKGGHSEPNPGCSFANGSPC